MKSKTIAILIFAFMVIVQMFNIFIGPDFQSVLFMKFTLFEVGVISAIIFLIIKLFMKTDHEYFLNRLFLFLIVILFIYQIVVVLPLLSLEGITNKELAYAAFRRSYLLVIPFLYLYLFPSFKKVETPILFVNVTGVILVILFFINHLNGYVDYTSTGEVRIAPGVATMIFAFMLITNLSFFSQKRNNYFFIIISLIGLVFANHKSSYLALFVLTLIALANIERIKNKAKTIVQLTIILLLIIIPLSQIPFIADNFWGRVTSSFTTNDPNAESRFVQYEMAWDYFKSNPINGSMINNKFYFDDSKNIIPPHSFLFQLLATQGLVGFAAHILILSLILYIGYKNRRDSYSFQMFLMIVYYIIFTLLNENFYSTSNILVLSFASALILYRNRCIQNAKSLILPYMIEKIKSVRKLNKKLEPTY